MKKLALSALVLAFAVSGSILATTGAEAQRRANVRPTGPGPETMAKQCGEATKGIYTADQRVFTYGYCVSRLNYYGKQQGYYGSPGAPYGQAQAYGGPPPGYYGQPPYVRR